MKEDIEKINLELELLIKECKTEIADMRETRNAIATRRESWKTTLKELNALNRSFSPIKKNEYVFDVSSKDMRRETISSIHKKIEIYTEEINKLDIQIRAMQEKLQTLMEANIISTRI